MKSLQLPVFPCSLTSYHERVEVAESLVTEQGEGRQSAERIAAVSLQSRGTGEAALVCLTAEKQVTAFPEKGKSDGWGIWCRNIIWV